MNNAVPQVRGAALVVAAVAATIRDVGPIPNGHLYAQLMGKMDLETYTKILDLLKRADLIKEENHVLTYIGPKD